MSVRDEEGDIEYAVDKTGARGQFNHSSFLFFFHSFFLNFRYPKKMLLGTGYDALFG